MKPNGTMEHFKNMGKKALIIGDWEKGKIGEVYMETTDDENGRPYAYIRIIGKPNLEVFYGNEYELIEERASI